MNGLALSLGQLASESIDFSEQLLKDLLERSPSNQISLHSLFGSVLLNYGRDS